MQNKFEKHALALNWTYYRQLFSLPAVILFWSIDILFLSHQSITIVFFNKQ